MSEQEPNCKSCGKPWVDHPGIQAICAQHAAQVTANELLLSKVAELEGQRVKSIGLNDAFAEVKRLVSSNAKHRKGFQLGSIETHSFVVHQAEDEMGELAMAVRRYENCIVGTDSEVAEELADVLGVLFHLAVRFGHEPEPLTRLMLEKFKQRFTE